MKKTSKLIASIMTIILLFTSIGIKDVKVSATTTGQDIINEAKKHLGKPYAWGGKGPNVFDCSGLTSYVYRQAVGIEIGGDTWTQVEQGTAVAYNDLQLGDLVFTNNVDHVGIYVGNGQYINAPQPGEYVKVSNITEFHSARRISGITSTKTFIAFTDLIIRELPDLSSPRIGAYAPEESFTIKNKNGEWYETTHGWVKTLDFDSAVEIPIINKPDSSGARIGTYYVNERFSLIGQSGDYWRTPHGYISSIDVKATVFTTISDRPSSSATRIGSYSVGERFKIIGEDGVWWETTHGYIRKL